jgi:hypothetical protein
MQAIPVKWVWAVMMANSFAGFHVAEPQGKGNPSPSPVIG